MRKLCKQNIQSLGLTMTPPNEAVLKYANTQLPIGEPIGN